MQEHQVTPNRMRRTVNDLVMAEMFLVQATIESAAAMTSRAAKPLSSIAASRAVRAQDGG